MNDKHHFDPTPEEQEYFEHSGCAGIVVACICIAIIFIVSVGIKLFAR